MSVSFAGTLELEEIPGSTLNGRAEWENEGLLVCTDPQGFKITVGRGARTDLGSVPQLAWSFGFPPDGIGVRAYDTHDLLYRSKGTCDEPGSSRGRLQPYTRAEADEILRQGLIACGVPPWRARAIWAAVRVGGANAWGT